MRPQRPPLDILSVGRGSSWASRVAFWTALASLCASGPADPRGFDALAEAIPCPAEPLWAPGSRGGRLTGSNYSLPWPEPWPGAGADVQILVPVRTTAGC